MSLDGKIATGAGESKWITRRKSARLRHETAGRRGRHPGRRQYDCAGQSEPDRAAARFQRQTLRRIILDPTARSPLAAKVFTDTAAPLTTLVVTERRRKRRVAAFAARVRVLKAPARNGLIDLRWLLRKLGRENVTSLLVEGGGETNASFLPPEWRNASPFFTPRWFSADGTRPKPWRGEGVPRLPERHCPARSGMAPVGARFVIDCPRWRNSAITIDMFTGIVEETGTVHAIKPVAGGIGLSVRARAWRAAASKPGDSVAVNGCCLTVEKIARAGRR